MRHTKARPRSYHASFFATGWCHHGQEAIKHIPVPEFLKKYFLSKQQLRTLARKKVVLMTKYKGRFFVAVNPLYNQGKLDDLCER